MYSVGIKQLPRLGPIMRKVPNEYESDLEDPLRGLTERKSEVVRAEMRT